MPIVAYLRVSDRHQVSGDGFDRQQDTINRWVRSQSPEPEIISVFREEGHTGTDFERPALSRLFEFCNEWHKAQTAECGDAVQMSPEAMKHIDKTGTLPVRGDLTVVVERPDRLARDLIVSELILQDFRHLGVQVVSAESGYDLTEDDDPTRKLVRQIMSALAEYEKSSIVQKLRKARERKRSREGRCEGAKPFGHYKDERQVLEYILELDSKVWSSGQIASHLNGLLADGYDWCRPRTGRRWNRGVVWRIIRANRCEG